MEKLLAHIAHVEVTTPNLDTSAEFYVARFGMRVVDRVDGAVFLRCWGDHTRYSLVLREAPEPGLALMAWRTTSPEALEAAADRVEAAGAQGTWVDSGHGHGRAYVFTGPYNHTMKLVWELDQYVADPERASTYPDRPERRSEHAAAPRFLDHVTIASTDVDGFAEWYARVLGFRVMARTQLEEAPITVFSVLTTNEKSHDLGILKDTSDRAGRVHHIAFWVDSVEDLRRSADVLLENGTAIEYGPSMHGIGEQNFLYFREPSGLRVEVNSGGYRNYVPDWAPRTWTPSQGSVSFYRNSQMPDSMMEAFPSADGITASEQGVSDEFRAQLLNPYAEQGRG
ncbi:MAG TPA: VOC family protein [Amycolatopsis sp.]|nr:VOC family protein [Amycolatopsis sp.]